MRRSDYNASMMALSDRVDATRHALLLVPRRMPGLLPMIRFTLRDLAGSLRLVSIRAEELLTTARNPTR